MFRGDFRDKKSFENRIKINFKRRLLARASNRRTLVVLQLVLELVLRLASGLLSG